MVEDKKVLTVVDGYDSHQRMIDALKKAAHKAGWNFRQVLQISTDDIATKKHLNDYFSHYVLWREIGGNVETIDANLLMEWVRTHNRISINTNVRGGYRVCSDKYFMHGIYREDYDLEKHTPQVFKVNKGLKYIKQLIERGDVKYPFVMKERSNAVGDGIYLIRNEEELRAFCKNHKVNFFIVQNKIDIDAEWRAFALGGTTVCVMRKNYSKEAHESTDFKKLSAGYGKTAEQDKDTIEEVSHVASRVATVSGMTYAGIDIVREKVTGHYYVLESNVVGGWMNGVERATGINVGDEIMKWFIDMDYAEQHGVVLGMKHYIDARLKTLSREDRKKYKAILEMSDKIEVDPSRKDLVMRILNAYNATRARKMDKESIRDLVAEVGQTGLSEHGYYVAEGTGTLEEGLVASAALIAIGATL